MPRLDGAVSSAPITGSIQEEALAAQGRPPVASSLLAQSSLENPRALLTKGKRLPVGQEGARAPGCGTGCSGSLRGACGWAVLPSCMPASQGHGLQKKPRAFSRTRLFTFSSPRPWVGKVLSHSLFTVYKLRCRVVNLPPGHSAQKQQG